MVKTNTWPGATLIIVGFVLCGSLSAAELSGSVQSSDGKPLSGTAVVIDIRASDQSTKPFSTWVLTADDGSFTATGLPAGKFVVCPTPTQPDQLSPCTWERDLPTVTLKGDEAATIPPIQLAKGTPLQVRVNDPTGALGANEGKVPGAHLFLGVKGPSGTINPMDGTASGNGRNYDLFVPLGVDLEIVVQSNYFDVKDSSGARIPSAGSSIPVSSSGQSGKLPTLTFNVGGA